MNIALRLIHAAWNGENHPARLWWLTLPSLSLRKRTGTSAVRSFMRTDLSTISDAYSHDCDARLMRSSASFVMPRMPQWMSLKRLEYKTLRMPVVNGVPRYLCRNGIDPSSMVPFQREANTDA